MSKAILSIILVVVIVLSSFLYFLPPKGMISVLMYHFILENDQAGGASLEVSVKSFERQMWFLKTFGYRTLSLDEYYEIKMGLREPKGREVLVTFDDGHRSYMEKALPIMEKYGIKSANFLIWNHLTDDFWKKDYMSLDEAKKIAAHPLVTFGSHSMTHPDLTQISNVDLENEIINSKKLLEEAFAQPFDYFAYPIGAFSPETVEVVKKARYRLAFSTSRKKFKTYPETTYSLPRTKISPQYGLIVFWSYTSGLTPYVVKLKHYFLQLTGQEASDTLNIIKPANATM